LDVLSVALGLAALAGVNLYLTVFATGLAIHFHWITLAPQYQSLEILGNPWIISIAGVLYLVEFFADKIPWVDSIWDAVHTVIRPIGGALLAIQVLGHPSPALTVIVALLAGGTSLIAHTAKAATRLASNTSPEPFSNIGLSLGEDAAVLGGLTLMHFAPLLALIIFLICIGAFWYFARRILRSIKAKIGAPPKKLDQPADRKASVQWPIAWANSNLFSTIKMRAANDSRPRVINSRRLRVNDVELNVVVQGRGRDVLLVHGFPDDHTVWHNQIPALVDAGYRVIALDTRGCGESEIKPRKGDYAIDKLVADLVALLDALGIAKVRLVGHDWGALQAWCFAMEHPERVDRYIAMSVGHPAARTDRVPGHALRLVVVPVNVSLQSRVSARQGPTVAPRATHDGLQLLSREPAPDTRKGVPAREGSGCRHLERRRCLPHRGSDARFGTLLRRPLRNW
jgi:pimeloyl-ACP methyl ester carboxylesterase